MYKDTVGSRRKVILCNIIWLITWGHVSDKLARYAVFNNSISATLCLHYLNIKSVLIGKVIGEGGLRRKHVWLSRAMTAYEYLRKGDIKEVIVRTSNVIRYSVWKSKQSPVLGYSGAHNRNNALTDTPVPD